MAYSCHIIDTRSGARISQVYPISGSWQTIMNGIGTGSSVFNLRDPERAPGTVEQRREKWTNLTQPWSRALVVSWAEFAVYSGLITERSWEKAAGRLHVEHSELRALAARRYVSMIPTYGPRSYLDLTGRSLRGTARQLALRAFVATPGDNWSIPLVAPPIVDDAGGQSFRWFHHDFETYEKLLSYIQDLSIGPDLAFTPVWTAASTPGGPRLEWWLDMGRTRIAGKTFEWNIDAEEHPVRKFREYEDASKQLSGVFALGEGSGADMLVGRSPLSGIDGPSIPDMDGTRPYKGQRNQGLLDSFALAELQAHRKPTVSQQFSLALEEGPRGIPLGDTFKLGARTRLRTKGDEFMQPGNREGYVVAMGGDLSRKTFDVEVQPL